MPLVTITVDMSVIITIIRLSFVCRASTATSAYVQPGMFTLDVKCVRPTEPGDRNNALVAILDVGVNRFDEAVAKCLCFVVIDDDSNPLESEVECGIQVTKCTVPQTITAEFVISP